MKIIFRDESSCRPKVNIKVVTRGLKMVKLKENFATAVGRIIWIAGIVGGLIGGKVFPAINLNAKYSWEMTSYNWGLAVGCIASSLITGALFMCLGNIQESIDKNSYCINRLIDELQKQSSH